jgi:COP9 signalosome complex subunit 5
MSPATATRQTATTAHHGQHSLCRLAYVSSPPILPSIQLTLTIPAVYENNVELVDEKRDAFYNFDPKQEAEVAKEKPWLSDPHHYKKVRVSAVALVKMTMHARSGGELEIMGLMQGYTAGDTIVITDAFRLPVEGTETRVNAQNDANEYIVSYLELCRQQGRQENVVGWYHSHPGYGCWLSGIDVDTQAMQQKFQDPCVAVVIDPDRTVSAGKVEIGAFRTLPPELHAAQAKSSSSSDAKSVPSAKAADFGAHANRYYSLEVSHFKSSLDTQLLDQLWHKYWVQTLSQNPMFTNRDYGNKQLLELGASIKQATTSLQRSGRNGAVGPIMSAAAGSRLGDKNLTKIVNESRQIASQEKSGVIANEMKAKLFNNLVSNES